MFEILLDRLNKMEGVKAELYAQEGNPDRYEIIVELVDEEGNPVLDENLPVVEFFRRYNEFVKEFRKLVESDEEVKTEISLMEVFFSAR